MYPSIHWLLIYNNNNHSLLFRLVIGFDRYFLFIML